MSWEDHIVVCKNKNGMRASFLLGTNAPLVGSSYKYNNFPYKKVNDYPGSLKPIAWHLHDDGVWRFNPLELWEERGWDLRPLKMHEDKPYDKAFLGYHTVSDSYTWFINAYDCPKKEYTDHWHPYQMNAFPDNIWNLASHTHSCSWVDKGYVFFTESEKEETVEKNVVDLQQKLIDYCCQKSSRLVHLKELQRRGVLDRNYSYDEIALAIRNYLKGDSDICADGEARALQALGLVEKKWIVNEFSTSQIQNGIRDGKVFYFVNKDGEKVTNEHTDLSYMYFTEEYLGPINFDAMHVAGVYE